MPDRAFASVRSPLADSLRGSSESATNCGMIGSPGLVLRRAAPMARIALMALAALVVPALALGQPAAERALDADAVKDAANAASGADLRHAELPPTTAADEAELDEVLAALAKGAGPARLESAKKVAELAPRTLAALAARLKRPHTASLELRRAVLEAIEAAVPDASGKFSQPKRQKSTELRANDEVDWLPALVALSPDAVATPSSKRRERDEDDDADGGDAAVAISAADKATAIAEVIVDVAILRALAASSEPRAAAPLFEAAFDPATMIYRDECGRYLRKMEPFSIPVLTIESQGTSDRRRYATYQLERIDRQEPSKALTAATADESLTIAILDAFRTTRHREAVYAVFAYIDKDAPRVREAARATWLAYVTGKPPPAAPKRKMALPGGKLAEKATPLWLTYRELADAQLRKASAELLGEELSESQPVDVAALSRRIFDHYDAIRAKREAEQWAQAQRLAESGDLAGAVSRIDQLLAVNPDRKEREQMAPMYLAHGKALQKAEQWAEAAAAFSKAQGLAPQAPSAKEAAAGRDYSLGKAMEAAGQDGTGLYRRAAATKPDFEEAAQAATGGDRPRWMLYVASLAGLIAVALAALGVSRRRRAA